MDVGRRRGVVLYMLIKKRVLVGTVFVFLFGLAVMGTGGSFPLRAGETSADNGRSVSELRQTLETSPERDQLRYRLARSLERQQQYRQAREHYHRLVSDHPQNPDYRYALSRVLFFDNQPRESLEHIRAARSESPDYRELYTHEINVLMALGRRTAARQLAQEARRRFPDASVEVPRPDRDWRIRWETQVDQLTGGREDWNTHQLELRRDGDTYNITGRFTDVSRFGIDGEQYGVRLDTDRWDPLGLFVDYQSASSVNYLADDHVRAGINYSLVEGINFRLSADRRNYGDTETAGIQSGISVYYPSGLVGYTFYGSRLELQSDRKTSAHHLFGRYRLDSAVQLNGGITLGETVEAVSSSNILRSDLEMLNLNLSYDWTPRHNVVIGFEYEDLEEFYIRRSLSFSISYDF